MCLCLFRKMDDFPRIGLPNPLPAIAPSDPDLVLPATVNLPGGIEHPRVNPCDVDPDFDLTLDSPRGVNLSDDDLDFDPLELDPLELPRVNIPGDFPTVNPTPLKNPSYSTNTYTVRGNCTPLGYSPPHTRMCTIFIFI